MIVHETRHARGDQLAPHRHSLAYAALVLDGAYEELGPDGVWRLEAGDLVVHPPFHFHLNAFQRGGARVLNFTLPHTNVHGLGAGAYKVMHLGDPARLARNAGAEALMEAMSNAREAAPALQRDWIDAMADALRADPRVHVGALARAFGVTPEHAIRAFARRFGMTPGAFRAEQRLRLALSALSDRIRSLAEIAASCGYADQAHFSRAVSAATGTSPARLRLQFS
jgi:AraC-like DNA-binding protein